MLTLYLTCLIVGGVFVGLSVLSGLDSDGDFDLDKDGDLDLEGETDAFEFGGDEVEHASMADASHGLEASRQRGRRLPWLPIFSFRFWTFGSAFFGLTGAVLTGLSLSVEPLTLGLSAAVGLTVGSASAWIVRALKKPVGGARMSALDFTGTTGELLLPLRAEGLSKVRLQASGGVHELVAFSPEGQALDKGARVVVLGVDPDGRVRVAPEEQLFGLEEP